MNEILNIKSNRIQIENYKSDLNARNIKRSQMYVAMITEFLCWLEIFSVGTIQKIKRTDLIEYIEYLTTRPNKRLVGTLSDSSIKGHYLALNMFFSMLLKNGVIQKAYLLPTFGKREKEYRTILSVEEIKEVISHCKNSLEKNIINIAYGCGLRRSEIEDLNVNDIFFNQGYLVVRKGKGHKRREVPLTNTIKNDLRNYIINGRPKLLKDTNHRVKALFVNPKGQRMKGDNLNNILRYIQLRTGNQSIIDKNVTLHGLRASIAVHLQEAGASMDFIRGFLGHCELDTTQIYLIRRMKQTKVA